MEDLEDLEQSFNHLRKGSNVKAYSFDCSNPSWLSFDEALFMIPRRYLKI